MANTKILKLKRNVKATDGSTVSVVLCKFPIDANAKSKYTIGKEDYIKVSFTTTQPIALEIGDYIDDDEIGIYKLHKRYKPEYSGGAYVYSLQLDSYYMMWDNQIMIYNPSVAAGNLAFTLTGMLELQCALLKSNLKYLGLQYRGLDFVCVIDTNNIKNEAQTMECNNTSILSFMNDLATKYECEWWIVENKIYFGKCEFTNANATEHGYLPGVSFTIGKNCIDMKPDESKIEYANRVYVFGGTNNITQRYRKSLIYKATDVSQYSSTQLLIKDSLRPLFAKYFKQSERSQQTFAINTSSSSSAGFETNIVSKIDTIKSTGTFDLSTLPIQFALLDSNGNTVTPSQTDTYELTARLIGSKNGMENVVAYNSVNGSFADGLNLKLGSIIIDPSIDVSTYFDYKITISVYPTITTSSVSKYKCVINGSYTFAPACPIINTVLVHNGSTYNVVVNQKQDSNTDMSILLPEGLTMAIGDTYTLPNIITGKVPQSQFTASEGETNNDLVYQGTIQKRLMLPAGTPYIQSPNIQSTDQIKTAVLVYDDIYPRFHGQKITSATYVIHTEKDDSGNITYQYPLFTISDNALAFDGNSILDDTKPMIIFQTGNLAGVSFTLDYLGSTNGLAQFTIQYDKDKDLPNTTLKPRAGDEYVLYNIDPSFYSVDGNGTLESIAENELLVKSTKDANIILGVNDTFNCDIKGDWLVCKGSPTYRVGQKVTLVNASYFESGSRTSRVIGWEKQLDCPDNNPTYIVGDSVSYDKLGDMQEQIDAIKFNGNTYNYSGGVSISGSSASIYIVAVDDKTGLSNDNTMSSLRILKEIANASVKHATNADNAKNADESKHSESSDKSSNADIAKNLAADSTDWAKMFLKSDFAEYFEKVNLGTESTPLYAIHAKYSLFSEGGITAYGKGSAGTGGSGSLDEALLWQILGNTGDEQIAANHLTTALTPYALVAALPTKLSQLNNDMGFVSVAALNGYATETWCNSAFAAATHTHNYLSKLVIGATSYDVASNTITIPAYPTTLPASDVSEWAKAATKPGYAFSEISSRPTTLIGYGITDALPLTGGILSGDLKIGNTTIYASGSNGGVNSIAPADDVILGDCNIGGHLGLKSLNTASAGISFYDSPGNNLGRFTVNSSGIPTWNDSTIWHAGNFTNLNQLTTRNFSDILNKPTTLAGYGITDAKIASGVIALGNNTITPLITHQTIYALTLQHNGVNIDTYTPNGGAKTINIATTVGTVTSVAMSVPTGFAISGTPLTASGTLALAFASGYSLPTTANQTNWNTAYSNNHTHSNKAQLDAILSADIAWLHTIMDHINYDGTSDAVKVSSSLLAAGGITAYTASDKRLKKNIKQIDALQNIRNLGGIYQFDYKKDGKHSVGLIAQNVQASIYSDMVYKRDNGYFAVNYLDPRLISLSLGAIIQVDDEVTALKKRVLELEGKIKNMEDAA